MGVNPRDPFDVRPHGRRAGERHARRELSAGQTRDAHRSGRCAAHGMRPTVQEGPGRTATGRRRSGSRPPGDRRSKSRRTCGSANRWTSRPSCSSSSRPSTRSPGRRPVRRGPFPRRRLYIHRPRQTGLTDRHGDPWYPGPSRTSRPDLRAGSSKRASRHADLWKKYSAPSCDATKPNPRSVTA